MKKLYIYLLFVGCVFSACDSVKDLQPVVSLNEVVSQAAVNAIKREFPEATQIKFSTLEKDALWESNFRVKVDQMSAIVDKIGKITETYRITNSVQLPENARDFINKHFPGASIKNVCQQLAPNAGAIIGYKVIVTLTDNKDIAIIFDATGTLIMVAANDRPGPAPIGMNGPPKIYFIDQKDLPDLIKTYLSAKHPNYTFIKAAVSIQAGNKLYSVVVSKDSTTFEYLFDEKSNVLRSGTLGLNAPFNHLEYRTLSSAELPQFIKDGLNLNFTNWVYENGLSFLQNGQLQGYFILVTTDKKQFSLQFDDEGNFVRGLQVCGPLGASSGKYEIKRIQPKDLPEIITSFLTNRYQEFSYIQTSLINDKDKTIYWIAIIKDNFAINYSFNDKGKVLSVIETLLKFNTGKNVSKQMQNSDITDTIKGYLDTFYSGWLFQEGKTNYIDNKLFSYTLVIKVGSENYILSFDAIGNFVAARKG